MRSLAIALLLLTAVEVPPAAAFSADADPVIILDGREEGEGPGWTLEERQAGGDSGLTLPGDADAPLMREILAIGSHSPWRLQWRPMTEGRCIGSPVVSPPVMSDIVIVPEGHKERFNQIVDYLIARGQWEVFLDRLTIGTMEEGAETGKTAIRGEWAVVRRALARSVISGRTLDGRDCRPKMTDAVR